MRKTVLLLIFLLVLLSGCLKQENTMHENTPDTYISPYNGEVSRGCVIEDMIDSWEYIELIHRNFYDIYTVNTQFEISRFELIYRVEDYPNPDCHMFNKKGYTYWILYNEYKFQFSYVTDDGTIYEDVVEYNGKEYNYFEWDNNRSIIVKRVNENTYLALTCDVNEKFDPSLLEMELFDKMFIAQTPPPH
ncbi:MAG: hypothetical protein GX166_13730 [Clostridiaceae bacterium]|jgi:hypothetical protein|nr:hypothetical protein [Clostridiaceae bacterium]